MKQFKCPMCNGLHEELKITMEVDIDDSVMYPGDDVQDLLDSNSIWAEGNCSFCSYTGGVHEFELTDEDPEPDNSPHEGQIALNFSNEFE